MLAGGASLWSRPPSLVPRACFCACCCGRQQRWSFCSVAAQDVTSQQLAVREVSSSLKQELCAAGSVSVMCEQVLEVQPGEQGLCPRLPQGRAPSPAVKVSPHRSVVWFAAGPSSASADRESCAGSWLCFSPEATLGRLLLEPAGKLEAGERTLAPCGVALWMRNVAGSPRAFRLCPWVVPCSRGPPQLVGADAGAWHCVALLVCSLHPHCQAFLLQLLPSPRSGSVLVPALHPAHRVGLCSSKSPLPFLEKSFALGNISGV